MSAYPGTFLECVRCGTRHTGDRLQQRCDCGGTLLVRYDSVDVSFSEVMSRPPGLWRFRELLPVTGEPVSLGEPETPLLFASRLSERWGVEVFVKDESTLPGGTFKARGASVGLSRARELGAKSMVMPSAGNAGGAWALYAARAGLELTVTMASTAPHANQLEVTMAGARLELVDGTIADAARRAFEIAGETGAFFAATFSEPYRVEGKKTAWLETFAQLGDGSAMTLPRTIVLPVGGGVAAVAAAKAAAEVRAAGWVPAEDTAESLDEASDILRGHLNDTRGPRLVGVQAEDCAPIVRAFERGDEEVTPWPEQPTTIAAGLRVPAPSEGDLVLEVIRASGGSMVAVTEDEIVSSVRTLAATEGIFACPEGAATIAAADRLAAAGDLEGPVVLYNTGSGVKYLPELERYANPPEG